MKHHAPHDPRMQDGSILVQFALMILVLVAILATVQIGYMYSAKRDLQRIADMAALESANAIKLATTCDDARNAGKKSMDAQWPLGVTAQGSTLDMVECGHWSKTTGFAATSPFNATRVTLTGESLQLLPFTGNRTITASATAAIASDPIASFTLGSGVARLNGGALNNLLTLLLGTSVNLSLIDYQGLANTHVNLLKITNALQLNAGNYSELLNTTVSLKDLLNASIEVAENLPDQATANIAIDAIGKLLNLPTTVNLANTFIHLLKNGNQAGLLDLGIYNDSPASALQADVSVLNVLTTALQVANADSAVALQTALDLGALAKTTVALKVIEPPVIATGPAGKDGSGQYITTAHTGQVRLKIELEALKKINASGHLLDINLILLHLQVSLPSNTAITLPVYVEVGSADGRLENIACHFHGPNSHKVSIGAKPGVTNIFLGNVPDAFTNTSTAWGSLSKEKFKLLDAKIKLTLLGGLLPAIDAPIKILAKLDLAIDDSKNYQNLDFQYTAGTLRTEQDLIKTVGLEERLGAVLADALGKNLLQLQIDTSGLSLLGLNADALSNLVDGLVNNITTIAGNLLPLLTPILNPIFTLLDSLLGPLLKTLGLQIGYADVELLWADCNSAQLVY